MEDGVGDSMSIGGFNRCTRAERSEPAVPGRISAAGAAAGSSRTTASPTVTVRACGADCGRGFRSPGSGMEMMVAFDSMAFSGGSTSRIRLLASNCACLCADLTAAWPLSSSDNIGFRRSVVCAPSAFHAPL